MTQVSNIVKLYAYATKLITARESNTVIHEDTGQTHEYRHLRKGPDKKMWGNYFANEFGRVIQGFGARIKCTDTCFLLRKR